MWGLLIKPQMFLFLSSTSTSLTLWGTILSTTGQKSQVSQEQCSVCSAVQWGAHRTVHRGNKTAASQAHGTKQEGTVRSGLSSLSTSRGQRTLILDSNVHVLTRGDWWFKIGVHDSIYEKVRWPDWTEEVLCPYLFFTNSIKISPQAAEHPFSPLLYSKCTLLQTFSWNKPEGLYVRTQMSELVAPDVFLNFFLPAPM